MNRASRYIDKHMHHCHSLSKYMSISMQSISQCELVQNYGCSEYLHPEAKDLATILPGVANL